MISLLMLAAHLACANKKALEPEPTPETPKPTQKPTDTSEATCIVGNPCEIAGMTLESVQIADSRCPVDVQCIWEGNATVTFLLEGASHSLNTLQSEGPDRVSLDDGRWLVLIDVIPYPKEQAPVDVIKRAKLRVE